MSAFWTAVAAVSLLGLAFGVILGYASRRFAVENDPVVGKTDEILLQSQCDQRGYPGCYSYTEVTSCNGEKINRYALGDETIMLKIAELFNVEPQPLDDEAPELTPARMMAVIGENNRTSCTKYIQTCPVNAIVDATRTMRTVMSDLCTGCNLCVDPCLIHYTSLQPIAETPDSWKQDLDTTSVRIILVKHHA